jgi:hypothetical protein
VTGDVFFGLNDVYLSVRIVLLSAGTVSVFLCVYVIVFVLRSL